MESIRGTARAIAAWLVPMRCARLALTQLFRLTCVADLFTNSDRQPRGRVSRATAVDNSIAQSSKGRRRRPTRRLAEASPNCRSVLVRGLFNGQDARVTAFDLDAFIASCVTASAENEPVAALREIVERAIGDPGGLDAAFPVPVDPSDDGVLFSSANLFVAQGLFPRGFATGIHDHTVAAIIGPWAGYEDNHLFRRTVAGIELTEVRRVHAGEVLVLEADAIHDVHAPSRAWTAALHVYLGDITTLDRSSWTRVDALPSPLVGADMEARWMAAARATGLVRET
jgi:predicted metal-dependent enzyme (double-stranded beta helix superfamily)